MAKGKDIRVKVILECIGCVGNGVNKDWPGIGIYLDFSFARPISKKPTYDYEVHSNMKSNPENTASHFFLLLQASRHFKIEKSLQELVLSENNYLI